MLIALPITAQADLFWSVPIALDTDGGVPLGPVACPTVSQCTTGDLYGREVTFDPSPPAAPNSATIDTSNLLSGIVCPSETQCTAVDAHGEAVTFNPAAPGAPASETIDARQLLSSIACPSTSQCTAVDWAGQEITFDPTSLGSPPPITIDPGNPMTSIACPSTSQCTAVDTYGQEVTFNPNNPGQPTPWTVDSTNTLSSIACPSASQCTAVDTTGEQVTFNPTDPGNPTATTIDNTQTLDAVACPSTTQCSAVDSDGAEITFNPTAPGSPTPVTIDSTNLLSGLACPSSTQCTAVDGRGQMVTFDPTAPGSPTPAAIDSGNLVSSVNCVSSDQCTAVDWNGQEVTFSPTSPGTPTPSTVDSNNQLDGVSCPTAGQCTAVDANGNQVTFNPTNPGTPTPTAIDAGNQLNAIACPSASQCTAVSTTGQEVTFNPTNPGTPGPTTIDASNFLSAIACPSTAQCTAVDSDGQQITFNPSSPAGATPTTIDQGNALSALSCPTSSQCTAVDDSGQEVTFNPTNPGNPSPNMIDTGEELYGIACPSTTQCVAVDYDGGAVQGDPTNPQAGWSIQTSTGASGLYAVACATTTQCIAVDSVGQGFNTDAANGTPAPISDSQPEISGTAQQGQILTELHAQWTNNPTGYSYQWEQCDAAGNNCVTIVGATSHTFTLTAANVGYTIRVIETAANQGGWGSPTPSAQTAVIQPPPAPVAPVSVSPPQIVGSASQGQTLDELHGSWTNYPTGYTYQWEDCDDQGLNCTAIPGATNHTYTLTANDAWGTVRVIETALNAAGPSNPATSSATAVVQGLVPQGTPINHTPPGISGTPAQGQTLDESHGSWTNNPTGYTYQWQDCNATGANCAAIAGATSHTYTVAGSDVGDTIRVVETAHNATETSSPVSSAATNVVTGPQGPPVNSGAPAITGPTTVGSPLSASPGSWTGAIPITYSYQWQLCAKSCKSIAGATSSSYTLIGADQGQTLQVVVTASNSAGKSQATSNRVGPVTAVGARFASSMWNSLAASGKAAAIPALLKNHGYRFAFTAPSAGKLVVSWYATIKHKQVLVAKASTTIRGAGKAIVKVTLTGAGRKLLKKSSHVALTADGTFTAAGQSAASGPKKFGVKH